MCLKDSFFSCIVSGMKKVIYYLLSATCYLLPATCLAASVVAALGDNPITDVDITERTKIMPPALNNRENAKNEIMDDYIKLEYARSIKIEPSEKEVDAAVKEHKHKDNPQLRLAARATLAWQMVVMRTIVPTISVGEPEIAQELHDLERTRGLPQNVVFLRLVDVPEDIYKKLDKPKSCDEAVEMVRKLGGSPQKMAMVHYELAPEVRERFIGLADLTWSSLESRQVFLICERKKTKEWGQLDDIIRQNAIYKRALFQADQLLKQLRRKATII